MSERTGAVGGGAGCAAGVETKGAGTARAWCEAGKTGSMGGSGATSGSSFGVARARSRSSIRARMATSRPHALFRKAVSCVGSVIDEATPMTVNSFGEMRCASGAGPVFGEAGSGRGLMKGFTGMDR